eukprot:m.25168 g.25168  ORF g.25168 m.25168 type:complete len:2051 (-) comp8684_c0_seq1:141-6293(-)
MSQRQRQRPRIMGAVRALSGHPLSHDFPSPAPEPHRNDPSSPPLPTAAPSSIVSRTQRVKTAKPFTTDAMIEQLKSYLKAIKRRRPKREQKAAPTQPSAADSVRVNVDWLKRQCTIHFGEMGEQYVKQMAITIFNLLASDRTTDDIQSTLFDQVGFDRIEFIQQLLQYRKGIVQTTLDAAAKAPAPSVKRKTKQARGPAHFAGAVVIQSAEEVKLQKQLRKEEKKQARQAKRPENMLKDQAMLGKLLGFETTVPQQTTQDKLKEAQRKSLFEAGDPVEVPKYPFVFDSLAKAQMHGQFVQNLKMMLPIDTERVNNQRYEEVTLQPVQACAPLDFERRIPISSLDPICQAAFKGFKELNRIQSIVCDTALKTNQNMLICAPTGAGKTNIAMLTILQCIGAHIEQGVIQKDKFKIVYVAPMKALAAEMTASFGKRLAPLHLTVKELTGDMQLSKAEILSTNMLVTTPEKWDVVTRKSTGDVALAQLVKLLIIDEVHLLHDERGAVIETLVARTLRQVESTQSMIRILGLSATLPNYVDVAHFLRVNPETGLFHFDGGFRPVPLKQSFIGIKGKNKMQALNAMDEVCYERVLENVRRGEQVMVFVHSRKGTVTTAKRLMEIAQREGTAGEFDCSDQESYASASKSIRASRNNQLKELFHKGFAIHHAGMLRSDRNMVEKFFGQKLMKVLVCTATLAWGVNLPAHAVVIKGTQVYDSKKSSFIDLGILDVQQIFGRAGRPQFDTFGEAFLITTHDRLSHYLARMMNQMPIESEFLAGLPDNLNAEVSLGTVANVEEAVRWLSYTFLYVRMRRKPQTYGLTPKDLKKDPTLRAHRTKLILTASQQLDDARMIRFQTSTGYLSATDMGRTASHFYIKYASVETYNEHFRPNMTMVDIFSMVCLSSEFEQVRVRDEELDELDSLHRDACYLLPVRGGVENSHGKVNVLLQTYITGLPIRSFSLISDMNYIAQNAGRIVRALFEIAVRRNMAAVAAKLLTLCKAVDRQMWWDFNTPLRQLPHLKPEVLTKIETYNLTLDYIIESEPEEVGAMLRHVNIGKKVKDAAMMIPYLEIEASIRPVTRSVLKISLSIDPQFTWNSRVHGGAQSWWIWVEDPVTEHLYHVEHFTISRTKATSRDPVESLDFAIPIFEPLPTQYFLRAMNDTWFGSETVVPLDFQHLILPGKESPHTPLLDLQPLPMSALKNKQIEALYPHSHFNPVQTQVFHSLYHTDINVLVGAPTGSGKTVAAELALFKLFRDYPDQKAVYIAPLKALVRERVDDWKVKLGEKLGKRVVELTGDVAPDVRTIAQANVIVTTPEKWDSISRSWQTRNYVRKVTLVVIDEIHLLGGDRGPILEVIVSRTNFISAHTSHKVRVVGLSTALSNAHDLANWLGITRAGLFNFKPSVRPVPLTKHIQGFPGKHYCPRMATMNKPAYAAIRTHSPTKPALIFVASRRQTRLTALSLISFCVADDQPKQFVHIDESELKAILTRIRDPHLRHTLEFGIGMHHAGLVEADRKLVETLFLTHKIQVLVATATLAWGVNLPAHLVIVKGTEFFDGKLKRYVDFDITDVLQMTGRAGRPQFDDHGVAVIFVQDTKKHFYKKFMHEPFPVESSLHKCLADHINAEIVAGTITSTQSALEYLTWTYFYRRLLMNPSYYGLDNANEAEVSMYLSHLIEDIIQTLVLAKCIEVSKKEQLLSPAVYGRIASFYYLKHETMIMFDHSIRDNMSVPDLLMVLTQASEFDELPVRHNEDQLNLALSKQCPISLPTVLMDSPNVKAHLLLQAHFSHLALPISDYKTDTKSVLDQCIRVLQAMVDVAAASGYIHTALNATNLIQMVYQARWHEDSSLLTIPDLTTHDVEALAMLPSPLLCLPQVLDVPFMNSIQADLNRTLGARGTTSLTRFAQKIPSVDVMLEAVVGSDRFAPTKPFDVPTDSEFGLKVTLSRNGSSSTKAHCPSYPKAVDESWMILIAADATNELVALKRLGPIRKTTSTTLSVYTPESPANNLSYSVFIMSSCYLGLDQQYAFQLNAVPAPEPLAFGHDHGAELGSMVSKC